MGYFLGSDIPFTWGLARTFPLADRWFCSVLGQTDPNRRYLISGTSLGLINDSFPPALPPNGTIFDTFNKHGITWKDYYSDLPTAGVYLPLFGQAGHQRQAGDDRPSSTRTQRPARSRSSRSSTPTTRSSPRRTPRTSSSATSSWPTSSTP